MNPSILNPILDSIPRDYQYPLYHTNQSKCKCVMNNISSTVGIFARDNIDTMLRMYIHNKLYNCLEKKISVFTETICVVKSLTSFDSIKHLFSDVETYKIGGDSLLIRNDKASTNDFFLYFEGWSNKITIFTLGTNKISEIKEKIISLFPEDVDVKATWVFENGGRIEVPINVGYLPVEEMYPFLNDRSLDSFYDSFMKSNSNILLLIGKPGTGKTTLIRGLLNHSKSGCYLSYNKVNLMEDGMFADFMSDPNYNFLIMEDADELLLPRKDGNEIMAKLLNLGDGLLSNNKKKFIFSTNLDSVDEIDPAFIRGGRCFEVLYFDHLTETQASELAKKQGLTLSKKSASYTIADVFNQSATDNKNISQKDSFGFKI